MEQSPIVSKDIECTFVLYEDKRQRKWSSGKVRELIEEDNDDDYR